MHADSLQKMHTGSCMRAYSTVQQLLCHGGYCELILSLARTSCRLLFTARPTARSLTALRNVVRSRNPSKSTLAHDAVATAVLHKHHPIIRVGAGLIQFVYRSHLRLATEATVTEMHFRHFSRESVCASKHVYAFPSSSIFIHTYLHIHMYVLSFDLYSQPPILLSFSCSINLIDTYVTVLIHVLITLLISLFSVSFCISIFAIHTHVCVAYALPSSSIPIHVYRHIDMYACFDYSVKTPCQL